MLNIVLGVAFAAIGSSFAAELERNEEALIYYVHTGRQRFSEVPVDENIIVGIVERLKRTDLKSPEEWVWALGHALRTLPASEDVRHLGKEALYAQLKSPCASMRGQALGDVFALDKDAALPPLLDAIDDSDQDVRIKALRSLMELGNPTFASKVEVKLAERKRVMKPEQVVDDVTLNYGVEVIQVLRAAKRSPEVSFPLERGQRMSSARPEALTRLTNTRQELVR